MSGNREFSRKLRAREKRKYNEELVDDEIDKRAAFSVQEKLNSDRFDRCFIQEMSGEEVNLKFFQQNGFEMPILITKKDGLGIKVPEKSFTVNDVCQCVGSKRILDVMDVDTQKVR